MGAYPASVEVGLCTAAEAPVQYVNWLSRPVHLDHSKLLFKRHELCVRVHCEEVWTVFQELLHLRRLWNTCAT